ncbi:MAG TPA: EAL domain-containing protein [Mobilitalea sp.]|nr:EAL domain-containing protein [Mobilitalea sp.]
MYRIVGLLLSLSIFSWVLSDILWAYYDLVLHINPDEIRIITYLYSLTNVFLTLSLSIFGFQIFRKWNILQILLDSMVMSYIILDLIWIVFLNEDVKKILALKSDWVSSASIMMDVLTTIWIIFWCMSIRTGKFPVFITLTAVGAILYSITDLVYYYEYLYSNYHPNSLLDAVYAFSFLLMAAAASIRISNHYKEGEISFHNTGRKGRAYILLVAPLLLIIFKGFIVVDLLQLVSVILIYSLLTSYVQNNIYKEGLLRKEKEHNSELEQKVKERTEELEESNRILQHLNNQDYITGLYNRRYLLTYLEETSKHLEREETIVLLYIDINRFKMMKTMYGHYIGEEILQELAIKIKPMKKLANKTILASYGDDTYIFAAVGPYNYWHGRGFAEEVVRLCSDIYHIDEYQIRITVNIGISIFPYDAITKEDLIKHADIAMSQARMQGFNMIHEFDLQLSSTFLRRSNIELMLKKADFGQEFMVYYQPQLQTDNRKIIGFEALLRWKTPFSEFISPAEFIPIAEETGCIIPIGEWVMKSVMKQLLDWNNYFDEKVMIGINVSLKQLSSAEFFEKLKEEVKELQIKPEWIDLEITESFQLQDNPDMIRMLEDIRNFGVKISVDDFGTGYSSLSYLKGLPIDRIKLARELIECIHTDDFDYQLVKSLIQLSKVKGIKVIAEGVETKEQWEILKELQCDEVQGYYFGRPAPVQEIEECYVRKPLDKSSVQFIRYFRSQ